MLLSTVRLSIGGRNYSPRRFPAATLKNSTEAVIADDVYLSKVGAMFIQLGPSDGATVKPTVLPPPMRGARLAARAA